MLVQQQVYIIYFRYR